MSSPPTTTARTRSQTAGMRGVVSAWPGLVLLDAVAAATFARCFYSPSELWLLVPVSVGAHVLAHAARLASRHGWRAAAIGGWFLAVVFVAWVPLLALDLGRFRAGIPLGHGATVLSAQMHQAWHIFSTQVSPVSTATGLVLAAAWACGLVGLAAEALDSDVTLPAVIALVPAFDVVVFTGTLGTSTGRAIELAGVGAFAVWYLAGTTLTGSRTRRIQTVVARVEEASAGPRKRSRLPSFRVAAPGLVVIAALGAGVVGPLLPGANSQALVLWHGGAGRNRTGRRVGSSSPTSAPVVISSLVRVGEEEVDNTNVALITVHSTALTREVLDLLDVFNGNEWSEGSSSSAPSLLPPVNASVSDVLGHLPAVRYVNGRSVLEQVITVDALGGFELPVPGTPIAASGSGLGALLERSTSGPVAVGQALQRGETYLVQAYVNPPPPGPGSVGGGGATSSPPGQPPTSVDVALPGPIPQNLVNLAHTIVGDATTPQEKAFRIQSYLADNPEFRYALPARQPSGAIADTGEGYAALEAFLFRDKVGYCQQYASAFAVLARIEGLPTRIAVGLLPGQSIGNNAWVVTGQEVHAWPQVYFSGVGWSDYEPTPSTPAPPVFSKGGGSTKPAGGGGSTGRGRGGSKPQQVTRVTTPAGAAKNTHPPAAMQASLPSSGGGPSPLDILLVILGLGALGLLAVPVARLGVRWRRRRDPVLSVISYWRDVLRVIAAAGYHRRRAETFNEFAQRVRVSGVLRDDGNEAFRRLALEVNRAAFGRDSLRADDLKRVSAEAREVRKAAWRAIPRWQRVLVEIDPRSLKAML